MLILFKDYSSSKKVKSKEDMHHPIHRDIQREYKPSFPDTLTNKTLSQMACIKLYVKRQISDNCHHLFRAK